MTLKYLLNTIARIAIAQKCINYSAAGTSLYQINPKTVDSYPMLFQSPTGNHRVTDNTTIFEISLYYLDRLLDDSSNDIDIYSAAIEQLKNIVRWIGTIEGVLKVEEIFSIKNFGDTENMDDRLAGAYTTIRIHTANNVVCPVE